MLHELHSTSSTRHATVRDGTERCQSEVQRRQRRRSFAQVGDVQQAIDTRLVSAFSQSSRVIVLRLDGLESADYCQVVFHFLH